MFYMPSQNSVLASEEVLIGRKGYPIPICLSLLKIFAFVTINIQSTSRCIPCTQAQRSLVLTKLHFQDVAWKLIWKISACKNFGLLGL